MLGFAILEVAPIMAQLQIFTIINTIAWWYFSQKGISI
jgi:hypothetical protein